MFKPITGLLVQNHWLRTFIFPISYLFTVSVHSHFNFVLDIFTWIENLEIDCKIFPFINYLNLFYFILLVILLSVSFIRIRIT